MAPFALGAGMRHPSDLGFFFEIKPLAPLI